MEWGFTGTERGVTDVQRHHLRTLTGAHAPARVHHGDCIGADASMHAICHHLGIPLTVHPPSNPKKRAYCNLRGGDILLDPRPYLTRNGDIVRACAFLVACPDGPERLRSGTWATVRYARRMHVPGVIIYPNGRVEDIDETRDVRLS